MTPADVAARFPSAKPTTDGWSVKCPVHDDRKASVSLGTGDDGRVLLHCHAGCTTADILAAVGLTVADLFEAAAAPRPPTTPVLTAVRPRETTVYYDYLDLDRVLLHQVVRRPKKAFRQRQRAGAGWEWKTSGRRVPYRWPDLVGQTTVWIVEGEKDVEACWTHGVPATCNLGGAGKWGAPETQALVDLGVTTVYVVPDADAPGYQHAQDVIRQCAQAAITATLVSLPDMPAHGDISDWWTAGGTAADLGALGRAAAERPAGSPLAPPVGAVPEILNADQLFTRLGEGRYRLAYPQLGIVLDASEIHRDRSRELHGEIHVTTTLAGAKTIDGTLLWASLNFSSQRTRAATASSLAVRSGAPGLDWVGAVETLALRVARAEAEGTPIQPLADYPKPVPTETWEVLGLPILQQHPMILFGDGGAAKSYLALHIAATLAGRGIRVLYADWEFSPEDHRDRLERLTGAMMPQATLHYVRCTAPLVTESQRLQRHIIAQQIQYIICDSIAFAVPGRPEDAEHAAAYFRAVRFLGIGSLHLAHTTKSLEHGTDKPFGSVFWSNGARSVWFVKRASEQSDEGHVVEVALSHKKSNTGRRLPTFGVRLTFATERTRVEPFDVTDSPELSAGLGLRQRIRSLVANRPMTVEEIATELEAKPDSIRTAVKRSSALKRDDENRITLTTALTSGTRTPADALTAVALTSPTVQTLLDVLPGTISSVSPVKELPVSSRKPAPGADVDVDPASVVRDGCTRVFPMRDLPRAWVSPLDEHDRLTRILQTPSCFFRVEDRAITVTPEGALAAEDATYLAAHLDAFRQRVLGTTHFTDAGAVARPVVATG